MEPVVLDTGPMECHRNYLINCRGLAKYPFRFHGKTPNRAFVKEKKFILLGDLKFDLLSETISKSKHLVHIYNTYGLNTGYKLKKATRTTAETNTLTYYIVTNKKDNVADSGIIPCGISDHDLVYIIRHARLPKINKDPKIVTVTRNLNNDTLVKDLNELPFELIRASADNPLVKLEIYLF